MIVNWGHVVQTLGNAVRRRAGACTTTWRATLRFTVLTAALLCYGAIPNATNVQSEVEAQLEEIAAESSHSDLRVRLRGVAIRHGESAAYFSKVTASPAAAVRRAESSGLGERLSLGLVLPLRC